MKIEYEKDSYALNVLIVEIIEKQGYKPCSSYGVAKDDIRYFKKVERAVGILYDDPKNKNYGGSFINWLCRLPLSNFIGKMEVINDDKLQVTVFGENYKERVLSLIDEINFKHYFKEIDLVVLKENCWEEFN